MASPYARTDFIGSYCGAVERIPIPLLGRRVPPRANPRRAPVPAGTNAPEAPSLCGLGLRHRRQYFVQVEGRRLLAWRKLGETGYLLGHHGLREIEHRRVIDDPIPIGI